MTDDLPPAGARPAGPASDETLDHDPGPDADPGTGPVRPPPGVAGHGPPDASPRGRRPLVERVGMAAIAAVLALLFGGVAAVSLASGEPFLAVMAAIGALMTAWVGGMTLLRG